MRKVFKILENIVFAIVIIIFFLVLSPMIPLKGMPRTFIVSSGSMEPLIPTGSLAFVLPADPSLVKVNDIVTFRSPRNYKETILHRLNSVISETPIKSYRTMGDNNSNPDAWEVPVTSITGKYVFNIPYLGKAAMFVRKPLGFIILVTIPALLLILTQIAEVKKGINDETTKRVLQKEKIDSSPASKTALMLFLTLTSGMAFVLSVSVAKALFLDSTQMTAVSFIVKDFVAPPVPTLISPLDTTVRNTLGMVMDWSDVVDYKDMHNPVYYYYQSSLKPDFSTIAYISGKLSKSEIPASGTPDGTYYWRVKACDAIHNCSIWSESWNVVVDNKSPVITLIDPKNNEIVDGKIDLVASISDLHKFNYKFWIKTSSDVEIYSSEEFTDVVSFTGLNLYEWDTDTVEDGWYKVGVGAVDVAGNKSKDIIVNIKVVNHPAPIVEIDETFLRSLDGYACGIGSALDNDGLKIKIQNWEDSYILEGHYKSANGSYNSWFELTPDLWGVASQSIDSAGTLTYTVMNAGNSPEGIAGWEVRVRGHYDGTVSDSFEYIITVDPASLVCLGNMDLGYETRETIDADDEEEYGHCKVTTSDSSENSGQSSLQVLKFNNISFAQEYKIQGYKKEGDSWVKYGDSYKISSDSDGVSTSGDVVAYRTYATSELSTAYYIQALDSKGHVLAKTQPENDGFSCSFTVDR